MISSKSFLRESTRIISKLISYQSTAAVAVTQERLQSCRTLEKDPLKHTKDYIGQFYTIDEKDKFLFTYGGLPKTFLLQTKTFNETCLMIRQPAIDIINCINNIDFSKPASRFVLYGKKGVGKSLSLAHIIHFASKKGFLIVNLPWLGTWMRQPKEHSKSETREGFVDQNLEVSHWLLHFKTQNAELLPNLMTTEEHIWSKRENTPKGAPLLELIDHGINRIKYASETLVALCQEIKNLSNSGICKTLVSVDGFNAFFYPNTRVFAHGKIRIHPSQITGTLGFLNITKYDWKNAVIVVTVDELAIAKEDQISHLPRYLLTKEGFEHLDPFVPVPVHEYSEKELQSCLDYYRERKWITHYPGQDEEVAFNSGNNPYRIMEICYAL